MNQKEQARLSVLNSVLEYQVPIAEAAELLGVSPRYARRMPAAYSERGTAALAHGNRGRHPRNATSPGEAAAVVQLAKECHEGTNHTHLTELLSDREGIDLSRPKNKTICGLYAKPQPSQASLADKFAFHLLGHGRCTTTSTPHFPGNNLRLATSSFVASKFERHPL